MARLKPKRIIRRMALILCKYTVPYIYMIYCHFIWITSKVKDETEDIEYFCRKRNEPTRFIASLWHQDVFLVSFPFRRLKAFTIASRGDAGEVITKMLNMCNFTVFRGGSSKGKKRRAKILEEFTNFMRNQDHAPIGITVDGSSGPIYQMKTGIIVMSMELNIPIYTIRIWCKRKFTLPTWDRTMIPLPFNNIHVFVDGPYYVPEEARNNKEEFDKFHKFLENEQLEITYHAFQKYEKKISPELLKGFPEGWQPKKENFISVREK